MAGLTSRAFSFCLHPARESIARVLAVAAGPVAFIARLGAGLVGANSVYELIPVVTANAIDAIDVLTRWGQSEGG